MTDQLAELIKRGRALPPDEREHLVDQLLESLNERAVGDLNPEWQAEIARRVAEIDSGAVQGIPAEEVFEKARKIAK